MTDRTYRVDGEKKMFTDVNQSPKALIRMPFLRYTLGCDRVVSFLIGLTHSSTKLPASSRRSVRTSSASAIVQKGIPVPGTFAFTFAVLTRSICCSMTELQVWEEEWWFERSPEAWVKCLPQTQLLLEWNPDIGNHAPSLCTESKPAVHDRP